MNLGVLPGGSGGYASGINDAEQIVGYAGTAMAINAGGQIVGSAQDLSGLSDAVLFRIGSTQSVLLET